MRVMWFFCFGIYLVGFLNGAAQTAGSILWEYDVGGYPSSPALATDGTIYVGGPNKLYAINPNGTLKWDFPMNSPGHPALGPDGTIYVGESGAPNFRFFAITPAGTRKWEFSPVARRMAAAVAGDGTIYVPSLNILHALAPNGSRLWGFTNEFRGLPGAQCPALSSFGSPAIGNDGTVYVPAQHPDDRLFALLTNGALKWTFSTGRRFNESRPGSKCDFETIGEHWSAPAIGVDGTVYIGACLNGASDPARRQAALYTINPAGNGAGVRYTGGSLMGEGAPVIEMDGSIYVPSHFASGFGSAVVTADGKILTLGSDGQLGAAGGGLFFPLPVNIRYFTVGPDAVIYAVTWSGTDGKLHAVAGNAGPANTPWPMFRRDVRQSGRVQIPATTPPTLRSLRRVEQTAFELSYTGDLPRDYRIEASSNLLQWRVVNTFFSSSGRVQFRDSGAADAARRFYRLVSP